MKLLVSLFRQMQTWDRSSKIAMLLAVVLLPITAMLALSGPEAIRQSATIGVIGLLLTAQGIVLWGNRGMVKPYTQAQRHFVKGEFAKVRDILEVWLADEPSDVDGLTLLANTYRYLGDLSKSAALAQQALEIRPSYHFALYGLGRTLLAEGQYAQAGEMLQEALASGAPEIVLFDLGHCQYRMGCWTEAQESFQTIRNIVEESYRELMIDFLFYKMDVGKSPGLELIVAGIPFWEASADRFQTTPYGRALHEDVDNMQQLLEEV